VQKPLSAMIWSQITPVLQIVARLIESMASRFNLARVTKKLPGQMQHMKSCEIDVAPIHNVDRSHLQEQEIERVHVVQLAVGDVDEARNAAAQIEQCVHLHGGLRTAANLTRTLLIRREY
jgi:conjugal transfer/entry exclusion protein